jgi:hypothetical protein
MGDAAAKKPSIRVHQEESAPQIQPSGKKRSLFRRPGVILGITALAIIGIIYLATVVFHSMTHQSTDDAVVVYCSLSAIQPERAVAAHVAFQSDFSATTRRARSDLESQGWCLGSFKTGEGILYHVLAQKAALTS